MSKIHSFNVTYDASADVLYIVSKSDVATKGIEDQQGIVWRYDSDGELIGATIMDFIDIWGSASDKLALQLAFHFQIPIPQANVVVARAIGSKIQ